MKQEATDVCTLSVFIVRLKTSVKTLILFVWKWCDYFVNNADKQVPDTRAFLNFMQRIVTAACTNGVPLAERSSSAPSEVEAALTSITGENALNRSLFPRGDPKRGIPS